jgi:hypothetical protein
MFDRLVSPFRDFGVIAGSLYVLGRVLQAISPRLNLQVYELMVQPISGRPLLPERFTRGITIREIHEGDPEVGLMPARPNIKDSRFRQGAICLGAYRQEELIGYLWLCFDRYEEDEVRCTYVLEPPGHAVFDFDLYVFPKHRMGLAFAGIWNGVNEYLSRRGIRFTFSRLTRFNLPSRKAHAHLGWKKVASAIFVQAWRAEVMFATIPPYVNLSVGRGSRVRLNLTPAVLEAEAAPVSHSHGEG